MFRIFQSPLHIPTVHDSELTIVVGLYHIADTFAMWDYKKVCQEYIDQKKHLVFMPLMTDKYVGQDSIRTLREFVDSFESEYIQLIEDFNVKVNDYNFIITPLYTNFNAYGMASRNKFLIKKIHKDFLNSVQMQQNFEMAPLTPDNILNAFNYSYKYIINNLDVDMKNIIFSIWCPLEVQDTLENTDLIDRDIIPMDDKTIIDVLSSYSSNCMREFILEHPEIAMWISVNNPSYQDFMVGKTAIYNLPRKKSYRYDYDDSEKMLFYIKELKETLENKDTNGIDNQDNGIDISDNSSTD